MSRTRLLRRFAVLLLAQASLVVVPALAATPAAPTSSAAKAPAAKAGAAALKKVVTIEGVTEYTLDNGLKVLLYPDDASTTTTVNITYKVGSRFESYGETGMAHLLEHLNFKGTPEASEHSR